jgi:phosphotransferase system HPr-like phosphotransfer protein
MSITLIADGQDEEAALDGLSQLIDSGFDNN